MPKRGIWSNTPWDPTGGRGRRGRSTLGAGDILLFAMVAAVAIAAAVVLALIS